MILFRRIIHIDDDSLMRDIVVTAFARAGDYEILSCAGGAEAVAKASAFGPEVILIDSRMPDMDGPETLQALRALPGMEDVPAIFMTGLSESQSAFPGKDNILGVIRKPFSPTALPQLLADMMARK